MPTVFMPGFFAAWNTNMNLEPDTSPAPRFAVPEGTLLQVVLVICWHRGHDAVRSRRWLSKAG